MNREEAIKVLRDYDRSIFEFRAPMPFTPEDGWVVRAPIIGCNEKQFTNGEDVIRERDVFPHASVAQQIPTRNKYQRDLKGVTVDVYDVLKAFNVTCPALQHLAKKALCAGLRGHKDLETDLNDILASAQRAIELNKE